MSFLKKFKDLTIDSLKEYKKIIIILYILFIILFIASWMVSSETISANLQDIQNASATTQSPLSDNDSPLYLFIHNERGGIVTYITSIFFGISAVVMLAFNALNLGAIGALFSILLPSGGLQYIIYLIPHGIFEITATVIQSVAGIVLFLFIWRFLKSIIKSDENRFMQKCRASFSIHKKVLIQSIVLMIFATILLIIAAPIEAYFSVPFSEFIMGV